MNLYILESGILKKENGTLAFQKTNNNLEIYPYKNIKAIYLFNKVSLTSEAIDLITRASINVFYLYQRKQIYGLYTSFNVHGITLLNQVQTYQSHKRLNIAKAILLATSHNMMGVLRQHNIPSDTIHFIKEKQRKLHKATSIEQLMFIESLIWKEYYASFSIILNIPYKRHKRNAKDPINAMINFLNTLLYGECLNQIIIAKLHPAISFLHSSNDRSTSLQLDISEIYKPLLVERTLFNLINLQKIDKTILNDHSDEPYRFDKENKYKIVKEFTTKLNTRIKKKNRYFTYKQLIFGDCISLRDYINNKTEKISFYHSRW